MSITNQAEFEGIQKVSEVVAYTLQAMREYARPGITTKQLDNYGLDVLQSFGARSAPLLTYGFPGCTCISVNNEVAHGIPSANKYLAEGDLLNIDVSAELNGFWADNGGSFVLGRDIHSHQKLVDASKNILFKAIQSISAGVRIRQLGRLIETEAQSAGFTVIRNLGGHGVGRSLHEEPEDVLNCYSRYNRQRFKENSVVAIETFISTRSNLAAQLSDGWTLVGNKGGFVAQHEHTIMVTDKEPIILTASNGIWN
ncbi:type I methionyl aminopeptidase [Chitinophaga silvatica]|uniref:Methionine aminopeptidase n=1 Tax=Chitinophaga silvatica TaxID=2282649 RepID=A0A3E1Y2J1_9BACT|nr:type I methionyl aminopeptidase [Chitinophaga silvatica]RFS18898.1 type I methionyl aminopeptidase [Chitinophaga silvatica]